MSSRRQDKKPAEPGPNRLNTLWSNASRNVRGNTRPVIDRMYPPLEETFVPPVGLGEVMLDIIAAPAAPCPLSQDAAASRRWGVDILAPMLALVRAIG